MSETSNDNLFEEDDQASLLGLVADLYARPEYHSLLYDPSFKLENFAILIPAGVYKDEFGNEMKADPDKLQAPVIHYRTTLKRSD